MSITDADAYRNRRRRGAQRSGDAASSSGTLAHPFDGPHPETPITRVAGGIVASLANQLASQDWLIVGFFAAQLGALALSRSDGRSPCVARVSADLGVYLLVLAVVRLPILRWEGSASSLLYRLAVLAVVLGSYFQLRDILPVVSPRAVDARIYAFDREIFGVEPALWMDRFVSPATTEWFAFFYFLYFLILAAHVVPMLFFARDTVLLARFGVGLLLLFLSAHVLYMVVPGWGPYWYLSGAFQHPLRGGTFWKLVREAVDAGGAQKDIFPSLHTAAPTYLAIFSFRHRRRSPFRYSWPVVAFFATQIIIATMFLRWHYLIDVVAGLVLAGASATLGHRIADWERIKRVRLGLQPAWMKLVYPWERR